MDNILKNSLWIVLAVLLLLTPGVVSDQRNSGQAWAQQAAPQALAQQTGGQIPAARIVIAQAPAALPADAPPMTAAGQATFQSLSPSQQSAVMQEMGKTGGQVTPGAVEALKARPEFKNLSPAEIAKGKELLQQQEAAKKEAAKPKEPAAKLPEPAKKAEDARKGTDEGKKPPEDPRKAADDSKKTKEDARQVIGDLPKGESLFERAQATGRYQEISLDLRPFGYDFFRDAAVKVVTDRKDIPIPMKYIVGPGDEVRIALWGRVNASYNLTIDRDGKIMIPGIGTLTVAGLTFEQMSQNLIKQAEQMTGTNVDISMGALRTMSVFILGDVRRPGAYTIGSFATMTDALLLAGGPTEIGSMRNIQLRRKDKVIQTFDLYDLLLKGDKSKDVILSAGDIVFVPVIGPYVGVAGNVKRPALYELKNDFSLESLFDLAGGIIPTGYTQQIQVERTVKNEKKIVIDIDDKNFARAKSTLVQDADIVKVFSIVDRDVNAVFLSGNVKKGGKYALTPGMRIRDILKSEQELLPETHFDYALIKRFPGPGKDAVLMPFSLADLLLRNDPAANLELHPADNIYIFSKWFFRDKPTFSISGEVRKGGQFDLAENFRVKDAILTAGDLTKDAYLKKGEIIRVNKKKEYRTLYFDVTRALADDPTENILLADEDQIIIHSLYEEQWKESVSVAGEVKNAGDFLLTGKMRVSDLIFKAGGQTRDTLLDRAQLYRTDWKTKEITLQMINLGKALQGDPAENVELKDLDRLIVHSIWEKVYKKNVFIEGEVKRPGTFEFGEKMTVRDLVFAAGGQTRDTLLDQAELYRTDWKTKEITLQKIDLGKALAGDPAANPELKDLDRLVVHSIWTKVYKKSVTVEGDVLKPGPYTLADNMTVRDLIFAAGNVLESASLADAEISSQMIGRDNQAVIVHQRINLGKAMAGDPAHNIGMKPYDRLFIKRIPDWRPEKYVTLAGEVMYPGRYLISKGERLSQVIERAGGFKNNAYLRGAVFTRERVREMQQKSLAEMADRLERDLLAGASGQIGTALSVEEVTGKKAEFEQKQKFIETLRKLKAAGRMTIYLTQLRLLKNGPYDIELEEGDNLLIPQKNSVVGVVGAVMTQSSLIYSDRMSYKDYINESGGYATFADRNNVFVMKVDGSARKLARGFFSWTAPRERWEVAGIGEPIAPIEPGDTIVVPEKVERIAWLREIRDITQILMNTAVAAGVVIALW